MDRGALITKDGQYRYWLSRHWDTALNTVGWIMLNPSTADHRVDDPTIRRCINFAKYWGYGGMVVVNLFALRSKNPTDLKKHPDPIGPDNNYFIKKATEHCALIVAAWGTGGAYKGRDLEIVKMFPELSCLKKTIKGAPVHPLYQQGKLKPQPMIGKKIIKAFEFMLIHSLDKYHCDPWYVEPGAENYKSACNLNGQVNYRGHIFVVSHNQGRGSIGGMDQGTPPSITIFKIKGGKT